MTPNSAPLLLQKSASLLLYQAVLQGEVGEAFLDLLQTLCYEEGAEISGSFGSLQAYGQWFQALARYNMSWQDYLLDRILQDDNPFSQQAQHFDAENLPLALGAAAKHDLQILHDLYSCSSEDLVQWVQAVAQTDEPPVAWYVAPDLASQNIMQSLFQTRSDWTELLDPLIEYYQQNGVGVFAEFWAFRWQASHLMGIPLPDPVQLDQLVGYQTQRDLLIKNTEFLLQGYPALNVLLYGSRGTGKSSLVKSLVNEYGDRGLRIIEIGKPDLAELPQILMLLQERPQKFILFVDDLSFEADSEEFKALKVVLEGGLNARPDNVVVYATSNRRHLVREFFGDRPRPKDADEVHAWDTVQEKLSFSDRFGLTLTFEPTDQDTYLEIVHHLAMQAHLPIATAELDHKALQWATRNNGRSGRTARQFIDFLSADFATRDLALTAVPDLTLLDLPLDPP
jgi:uncharacterized protein